MRPTDYLREGPGRMAGFLERHERLVLCAIAVLGIGGMVARATSKPFWFDELATLYVARISGLPALCRALAAGADANPPLYYLLMHAIGSLLGEGDVVMRLLSMLGFGVMAGSVYLFVRRRCGTLCAFVALLVSLGTAAFPYSYEARPYAPVLGCCGLAMLFWQRAAETQKRTRALVGLAVSLGLAISLHYYAVFLLVPLLLGEGVRWLYRRKTDFAVLGAIVSPGVLSLAYLPMALSGARCLNGCGGWGAPGPDLLPTIPLNYSELLPSAGLWISLIAVLLGIAMILDRGGPPEVAAARSAGPPAHEWAFAVGLVLLPLWVVLCTLPLGLPNGYLTRYSLSCSVGVSVLIAFLARGNGVVRRKTAAIVCALLLAHFAGRHLNAVRHFFRPAPPTAESALLQVVREYPGLPLVFDWRALSMLYYGPREISSRIVVLRDPELSYNVQCLETLAPYAPVVLREYRSITSSNEKFLLWKTSLSHNFGTLMQRMRSDGLRAEFLAGTDTDELYIVTRR